MQSPYLSTEKQKRAQGHVHARITLALTVTLMVALLVGSPGAMHMPAGAAAPPTPSPTVPTVPAKATSSPVPTVPVLPTAPTHRVTSRANGQPPAYRIPGIKPAAAAAKPIAPFASFASLTPFVGPADGHITRAAASTDTSIAARAARARVHPDMGATTPAKSLSRPAPRVATALFVGSIDDDSTSTTCNTITNTDCTLRQAIRIANDDTGDTISLATSLALGDTITLTSGALYLSSDMTINGGNVLTVDGNGQDSVFVVHSGVTATLSGIQIVNAFVEGLAGGGIYNAGTLSVVTCFILGNTANGSKGTGGGGGIFNDGGTLSIVDSIFIGNSTDYSGGAIGNDAGGVLTLVNSTLFFNIAAGNGGGIENFVNKGPDGNGALVRVIASTITSNFAVGKGGGIRNAATNATLSLGRNAIGGNASSVPAGPPAAAAPRIQPACECGGSSDDDVSNDRAAALTDTGYNVVGIGDIGAGLVNGVHGSLIGTASAPLDLLLDGALGPVSNGGPTPTLALLPGSPAIERVPLTAGAGSGCAITYTDAATGMTMMLNTDQRGPGFARPLPVGGICDAGAFESGGFDLTKSGDGQSALPNATFTNPLGIGITPKVTGEPVDGGFITFVITPNPNTGAAATFASPFASPDPNCDVSFDGRTADCIVIHDMTGDHATTPLLTANGLGGDFTVIASLYGAFPVTFTLTNSRVASLTVVTNTSNPTTYGQPITLTATVTGTGGTPSGSVTFFNGATTLGTLSLGIGGTSMFPTSVLPVGMNTITVQYLGDAVFAPGTSASIPQTVTKATPILTVTNAPNPSAVGQAVTLTAQVVSGPPGATMPTGAVTFTSGMTALGTATLVPSLGVSVATTTTSVLPVGSNPITAQYAGDSNYLPANGGGQAQIVQGTLVISPATLPAGVVTVAYNQPLTVSGGQVPYTLTLLSGTLPPGIALVGTAAMPTISGTPTTVGVYTFTIKVTDSTAATTQTQYTLTVGAANVTQIVTTTPSGSGSGNGGTPNAPVIRTLGTITLGTVGSYTDGTHGGVTGLTYTGYDPNIISISASGVVTGIAGGTTTVTITAPNGVTTTITITVSASGGGGLTAPNPQPMAKPGGVTVAPGATVVVQPMRR